MTDQEFAIEFNAHMNGYLRLMRGFLNRDETKEETEEIEFLSRNRDGKSLFNWFEIFDRYMDLELHYVCLWIINQGYMTALKEVFEIGMKNFAFIPCRISSHEEVELKSKRFSETGELEAVYLILPYDKRIITQLKIAAESLN